MVKRNIFLTILTALLVLTLSSCSLDLKGESLHAFTGRINDYGDYCVTPEGFIIDEGTATLSRFFRFGEDEELLIKLHLNERNRINEMHIVFENKICNNTYAYTFILDCIKAFCNDESTFSKILEKSDFENNIKEVDMQTKSAEHGNVELLIDTTEIGTVVSIYKEI